MEEVVEFGTMLDPVKEVVEHKQYHGLAKMESMQGVVVDMEEELYSHRTALCLLVQVGGCFETVELQELVVLLD